MDRQTITRRRSAARETLERHGIDALLVSHLINARYLSGFTGSNGSVLVGVEPSQDAVATDARYTSQVALQAPELPAIIARDTVRALAQHAHSVGIRRIGVEADAMTITEHTALVQFLADLDSSVVVVPTQGVIEDLRSIKSSDEIAQIQRACDVADQALAVLIEEGGLRPGLTERFIARRLNWLMGECGADAEAFETIVAAGAHSAIPHHRPTSTQLQVGDFVKCDFGALVGGYHSDMTRTFVIGKAQAWQHEVYSVVFEAQRTGLDVARSGAACVDVDRAARSVITDAGFGDNFVHGLGHGVGLEIHEAPSIGKLGAGTLFDGAVVTVEPGVYLPGRGGVRIEDTLVVQHGAPQVLTSTSKAFTVI